MVTNSEVDADELEAVMQQLITAETVLERLTAVARLERLVTEVKGRLAREALSAGHYPREVGTALGISRQAAVKRYREEHPA